jgi:hypothetical protein
MKTIKKEILALMVICLVLTFSAASACAEAVSTSKAQIDWTSLTITGDITWSDKGSQSYAYVEDATGWDEDIQTESGWVGTSAFASIAGSGYHAYGDADTNNNSLYEEVYAIANDATTTWAYAEAEARRWGYFTANSNGWVTFSSADSNCYELSLSQDLETGYVNEWAYGYAEAGLRLLNDDTSDRDEDMPAIEIKAWYPHFITVDATGKLTVAVWFDAGNKGEFDAWVYNEANVEIPEPATIGLLGLGTLSLIRRKK